jgi:hypothetical protein
MVIYHFMWNRDRSERRWQLMGVASRLAQSVGLRWLLSIGMRPFFKTVDLQIEIRQDGISQSKTFISAVGCFGIFSRMTLGWWVAVMVYNYLSQPSVEFCIRQTFRHRFNLRRLQIP